MKLTKPQFQLMLALAVGARVEYIDNNYTLVQEGQSNENFWPSTFYGLWDNDLVRADSGGYVISDKGQEVLDGQHPKKAKT